MSSEVLILFVTVNVSGFVKVSWRVPVAFIICMTFEIRICFRKFPEIEGMSDRRFSGCLLVPVMVVQVSIQMGCEMASAYLPCLLSWLVRCLPRG